MRGYPQLSRLPAKSTLKSLNFRRVTPGSASGWYGAPCYSGIRDPTHPMANRPAIAKAPRVHTAAFMVKVLPKACLYKPDIEAVPPVERKIPAAWPGDRRVNMSILNFMSKAKIHKSAVIRKTIINRIHSAFTLVITRGADCEVNEKGKEVLVLREKDIGQKWVMQDWTYLLWPKLDAFKMPWPALVKCARTALSLLTPQMRRLEAEWTRSRARSTTSQGTAKYIDVTSHSIPHQVAASTIATPSHSPHYSQHLPSTPRKFVSPVKRTAPASSFQRPEPSHAFVRVETLSDNASKAPRKEAFPSRPRPAQHSTSHSASQQPTANNAASHHFFRPPMFKLPSSLSTADRTTQNKGKRRMSTIPGADNASQSGRLSLALSVHREHTSPFPAYLLYSGSDALFHLAHSPLPLHRSLHTSAQLCQKHPPRPFQPPFVVAHKQSGAALQGSLEQYRSALDGLLDTSEPEYPSNPFTRPLREVARTEVTNDHRLTSQASNKAKNGAAGLSALLKATLRTERTATTATAEQADKLDTATKVQMSKHWSEDASFVRALIEKEEERRLGVRKAQKQVLEQLGFRLQLDGTQGGAKEGRSDARVREGEVVEGNGSVAPPWAEPQFNVHDPEWSVQLLRQELAALKARRGHEPSVATEPSAPPFPSTEDTPTIADRVASFKARLTALSADVEQRVDVGLGLPTAADTSSFSKLPAPTKLRNSIQEMRKELNEISEGWDDLMEIDALHRELGELEWIVVAAEIGGVSLTSPTADTAQAPSEPAWSPRATPSPPPSTSPSAAVMKTLSKLRTQGSTKGRRTLWTLARPFSTSAFVCEEGKPEGADPAKTKPFEEREKLIGELSQLLPEPGTEASPPAEVVTRIQNKPAKPKPEPEQLGDVWETILDRFVPPLDIPAGGSDVRYALPRSRSELGQLEQGSDRALLDMFVGAQSESLDSELSDAEMFLGRPAAARMNARRETQVARGSTTTLSPDTAQPDLRKFLEFDPFDATGLGPSPRASGSGKRSAPIDVLRSRKSDRPGSRAVTRQPHISHLDSSASARGKDSRPHTTPGETGSRRPPIALWKSKPILTPPSKHLGDNKRKRS